MPGICGATNFSNKLNIQNTADSLIRSLKHVDYQKVHRFISPENSVCFGKVNLETFNYPVEKYDHQHLLIYGDIIEIMDPAIDQKPITLYEKIIELRARYKENFPNYINGSYILLIWDESEGKLEIVNDRYGLRPLYFSIYKQEIFFSSELRSFRDIRKEINPSAVVDILSFGYILGDKSLIEDVNLLPPGSILTFYKGKLSIRQYWSVFDQRPVSKARRDRDTLEEIRMRFNSAVNKCFRGDYKVGISLSGGLDTRAILSAIDKNRLPIYAYTYLLPENPDAAICKEILKYVNLNHYFYCADINNLTAGDISQAAMLTDGVLDLYISHLYHVARCHRDKADIVLNGFCGELARGRIKGYLLKFIVRKAMIRNLKAESFFRYFYKMNAKMFYPHEQKDLFSTNFYNRYGRLGLENMCELLSNYPSDIPNELKMDYFYLIQIDRRFLLAGGQILTRNFEEVRTPFTDYEYMDSVLKTPLRLCIDSKIIRYIISENNKDLAKIEWDYTLKPISYPAIFHYVGQIANELKHRFSWGSAAPSYDALLRGRLRWFVKGVFDSMKKRNIFNPGYLDYLVDEYLNRRKNIIIKVSRLIMLELYLKCYLED